MSFNFSLKPKKDGKKMRQDENESAKKEREKKSFHFPFFLGGGVGWRKKWRVRLREINFALKTKIGQSQNKKWESIDFSKYVNKGDISEVSTLPKLPE